MDDEYTVRTVHIYIYFFIVLYSVFYNKDNNRDTYIYIPDII